MFYWSLCVWTFSKKWNLENLKMSFFFTSAYYFHLKWILVFSVWFHEFCLLWKTKHWRRICIFNLGFRGKQRSFVYYKTVRNDIMSHFLLQTSRFFDARIPPYLLMFIWRVTVLQNSDSAGFCQFSLFWNFQKTTNFSDRISCKVRLNFFLSNFQITFIEEWPLHLKSFSNQQTPKHFAISFSIHPIHNAIFP